jgi:predicted nucleotidyltransferase
MREQDVVKRIKDAVVPVLTKHGRVVAAYLFGSTGTEQATAMSDLKSGLTRTISEVDESRILRKLQAITDSLSKLEELARFRNDWTRPFLA